MKKYIILTISAIVLLSCNQIKTNQSENPTEVISEQKSDTIKQTPKLSLVSAELKLSEIPNIINVTMTNNTNDTITTGEHFRIEKFENNEWIDFTPKDVAFNDIGYELKPYGEKTFNKNLFKNKIDYKLGKYRIAKNYLKSDYQQTNESFDIYVEFEIN
ncbi:immunoglobulin-like domain-containing protein [Mesonia maritima]|uniref:Bacterial Ig-like domain-containing protein n=1 Tax=Mesonia maritima TaxID=1793873 RepID=A0ABU1K6D1_9FLAO|nr:immunoglobulin-like domain-containing protein [Mesonia maritima]MDR6300820.1 hypothetical protein [Mesonia maritima]